MHNRDLRADYNDARGGLIWLLALVAKRIPSQKLRWQIYRHALHLKLAPTVRVHKGVEAIYGFNIRVGDGTVLNSGVYLDGREGIEIGRNVNVGGEVAIFTLQHDPQAADFGVKGGPVRIGDRAWLSHRSIILPGVTIGEGAVVAAGAVVTKDVEPFAIVTGVPATPSKRTRNRDLTYELAGARGPWFI